MMASDDEPGSQSDLDRQNRIDVICDRFEAEWQSGSPPDIQEFLNRTESDLHSTLVVELIRVDMEYASNSGGAPTVDDYKNRFPQFAKELEELQHDLSTVALLLAELKSIGKLQLRSRLGGGGFGTVWKAWDPELEREVAVKLPNERSLTRDYSESFLREAKAAARLNHPGLVRVIKFGEDLGISYIVYDLVDGCTLREWMKRHPVTPTRAATLTAQIADALAHAHSQQVFHRDLKPGNIMIDAKGLPLITDFGLAKRADSDRTDVHENVVVGTIAYINPEQAEGKPEFADARSDIFSLGMVLYELLAGRPPFTGEREEILRQVRFTDPPPMSQNGSRSVPAKLEQICRKCLAKQQSHRYQDASDLAADLREFIDESGTWWRGSDRNVMLFVAILIFGILTSFVLNNDRTSRWNVQVLTEPPGARVYLVPRNPETGELYHEKQISTNQTTPLRLKLLPGQYQATVSFPNAPSRTHEVRRTVPPIGATLPWGGRNAQRFQITGPHSLDWPVIKIPPADVNDEMVYIEGADAFPVGHPAVGLTVRVAPFYVSQCEFTYGDFLKLRPGERGNVPGKNAIDQSPDQTMPVTWEAAEHWAEESGGRLLTEIEFAYLARMAAKAEAANSNPSPDENFGIARGNTRDAIPTSKPVFGILSGFSEWVGSMPNQYHCWPAMKLDVPPDYRVIRGGTARTAEGEFHRKPDDRTMAKYFEFYPTVGFRVARSAHGTHPRK